MAILPKREVTMKKGIIHILHSINKVILPSFHKKDLNKLTKLDKLMIGYKLWIAKELAQNVKPLAGR